MIPVTLPSEASSKAGPVPVARAYRVTKRAGPIGSKGADVAGSQRRRGRPATAALVWESHRMQRNLIRLYYCTDIKTGAIGKILSALASKQHGVKLHSGKRSTQTQLQRLFLDPAARPRTTEAVKERLLWFRLVRNRKHLSNAYQKGLSILDLDYLTATPVVVDLRQPFHEQLYLHPSRSSSCRPAPQKVSDDEIRDQPPLPLSRIPSNSSGPSSMPQDVSHNKTERRSFGDRRSWSWSWVRASVASMSSGSRPPSSIQAEIRSLLSFSTGTSLSEGGRSSRMSTETVAQTIHPLQRPGPVLTHGGDEPYVTLVTQVCCIHRESCLHRKVANALAEFTEQTWDLANHPFQPPDFEFDTGRTILNETALHIAARWDAPVTFLCWLALQCPPSLLNVKDYSGNTFMHFLHPKSLIQSASLNLFFLLKDMGFPWTLCNFRGESCLASIVCKMQASVEVSEDIKIYEFLQRLLRIAESEPQSSVKQALLLRVSNEESTEAAGHRILQILSNQAAAHSHHFPVVSGWLLSLADDYRQFLDRERYIKDQTQATTPDAHTACAWSSPFPSIRSSTEFNSDHVEPNAYYEGGETVINTLILKVATGQSSEDSGRHELEALLSRGADLRLVSTQGDTALHHAARSDLPLIVETLIENGASLKARNTLNETPLDLWMKREKKMAHSNKTGVEYSRSTRFFVRLLDGLSVARQRLTRDSPKPKGTQETRSKGRERTIQISGPVELTQTTNMLSWTAPDIRMSTKLTAGQLSTIIE